MAKAMRNPPAKTVEEYVNYFPAIKSTLQQLRRTIKAAAPKAEEVISYGIAGYKYHGMLIYFAAWEKHIGMYPAPWGAEALKKEMAAYEGSKGTIKFPLDKPLPLSLITKIVKYKVKENEIKAAVKKSIPATAKTVKAKKTTDEEQVKQWLSKLDTPVKKEIEAVRKIIKASTPKLSERIKWNAPSYYYKEDIVTFGPYKKDKLLLVFHHPSVVKIDSALLQGNYKDRRLVYFKNKAEAEKNKKEISRIISAIVKSIDKK